MGKVISLDKYRKAKDKANAEASKQAESNRRPNARTKAERERQFEERQKQSLESKVDGTHLDPPDHSDDP